MYYSEGNAATWLLRFALPLPPLSLLFCLQDLQATCVIWYAEKCNGFVMDFGSTLVSCHHSPVSNTSHPLGLLHCGLYGPSTTALASANCKEKGRWCTWRRAPGGGGRQQQRLLGGGGELADSCGFGTRAQGLKRGLRRLLLGTNGETAGGSKRPNRRSWGPRLPGLRD